MADRRTNAHNVDGSQGSQGRSQYRRRYAYQRNDRGRRAWSDREEAVLISALKELVALGWKADNGFRGGYLQKIEECMQNEFPRTDIKANPHIQSKLTTLKKHYNLLSMILDRSGVGFNVHGDDFKIDCSDEQWDQIVKQDKHARGMRTRAWPYWEDWKLIFGKDGATGRNAEGVGEAAGSSPSGQPVTEIGESSSYLPSFEDFLGYDQVQASFGDNVVDDSSVQSGQNASPNVNANANANANTNTQVPPNVKRKRQVSSDDNGLVEMLGKAFAETSARLDTLSARIGYEMDLGKARQEIFHHLCNIPELTENERYDLVDIIGKENSRLEIFRGLPDASKLGYAKRVLEKECRP